MTPIEVYDKLASLDLTVEEALLVSDRLLAAENSKTAQAATALNSAAQATSTYVPTQPSVVGSAARAGGIYALGKFLKQLVQENSLPVAAATIAAPVAGAYFGGKMLGSVGDVSKEDIREIQEEELIRELKTNSERLRRQKELLKAVK